MPFTRFIRDPVASPLFGRIRGLLWIVTSLCALTIPALAQAPYRATDASVRFAYRVTFIPVNGTAEGLSSATSLDFANLGATKATVSVDLNTLRTGIGLRDQHAREALGAAEFPNVVFALKSFTGAARISPGETVSGQVGGTFTLKGVTKPLSAPVTLSRVGDRLNVSTEFTIHPQEHGVVVRGADQTTTVTVTFTLTPGS